MTTTTPPTPSVQLLEVSPEYAGQRIDNFLITALKGVPKTLIYRILRKGEVRVNKGRVKPEYKIQAGDIVRVPPVRLPERDEPAPVAQGLLQRLEASIVYEDSKLIVINSDLPESIQRIIIAHELGHAVLHSDSAISAFHEFAMFDDTDRMEYEANVFAAEFMLSDDEVMESLEKIGRASCRERVSSPV